MLWQATADDCMSFNTSVSQQNFDCTNLGANNITVTSVDASMNSASCMATVTVLDTISPTAVCMNATLTLNANGIATLSASDIDGGSSDNCGVENLSVDVSSFTCANLGPNLVTLTVTDASGNSSSCTATVTIETTFALVSTDSTSETCILNNGTVTVNVTGGSGSYTYAWDAATGNQTTQTATGLAAGTYSVTVTDANQSCVLTTSVMVRDDCNIPASQVTTSFCGITASAFDASGAFFCDLVPGATNYEWEFTNGSTVLTKTRNNSQRNMWFGAVNGIQAGLTYSVRVRAFVGGMWGPYGVACDITAPIAVPETELTSAYCNIMVNTLATWVTCNSVPAATDYEFQFTNQSTGAVSSRRRGSNQPNMLLNVVSGLVLGATYDVQVRAYQDELVGNYGPICTIQVANSTTRLDDPWCGSTGLVTSFTTLFNCVAIPGSSNYEWEFTSQTDGTVLTRQRGNGLTNMFFAAVQGAQINTGYDVRVRAFVNGVWTEFGTSCSLFFGDVVRNNAIEASDNTSTSEISDLTVSELFLYPNPNRGHEFVLELSNTETAVGAMQVDITDMLGKIVHTERIAVEGTMIKKRILFDHALTPGMYLVNATLNGKRYVKQLIIQ